MLQDAQRDIDAMCRILCGPKRLRPPWSAIWAIPGSSHNAVGGAFGTFQCRSLRGYGANTPHLRKTALAAPNGSGVKGPGGARVIRATSSKEAIASQKQSQKPSI
jgi:hypothetical protein